MMITLSYSSLYAPQLSTILSTELKKYVTFNLKCLSLNTMKDYTIPHSEEVIKI